MNMETTRLKLWTVTSENGTALSHDDMIELYQDRESALDRALEVSNNSGETGFGTAQVILELPKGSFINPKKCFSEKTLERITINEK